jgi:hypothetical protein
MVFHGVKHEWQDTKDYLIGVNEWHKIQIWQISRLG